MSSSRPTNGLTNVAPTFAASSACAAEKISVTLTRMPSDDSVLHAWTPALVNGTLTTMCSSIFGELAPFAQHAVDVGGDDLGAGRPLHDLADLLQDARDSRRLPSPAATGWW